MRVESQGLLVEGSLDTGTTGPNTLGFHLTYSGEPVTPDEVFVSARLPEKQLGPITAITTLDTATGEYEASFILPISGEWQFEISARISTYEQPIVIATIPIA